MIVNMPANGAGSSAPVHPPSASPSATHSNNNNSSLHSPCEFNFLKRKFESPQVQQVEQPQLYEQLATNPWKKRHLDYDVANSGGEMCFQLQLDTSGNTATNNSSTSSSVGVGASFINDLFAYDSSLLVPAASYCAPPTAPLEADAGGWQTGELLELDHRYNSGLQTEISQLNATLPPPPPPPPPTASTASAQQQQQEQRQSQSFLVPIPQKLAHPSQQRPAGIISCSRRSSPTVETEPDFEDKNLSWLLNFKFDEFPHLSPDVGGGQRLGNASLEAATPTAASHAHLGTTNTSPCSSASPASASNSNHSLNSSQSCSSSNSNPAATTAASATVAVGGTTAITQTLAHTHTTSTSSSSPTKTGRKFEELVMEVTSELDANEMIVAEHVVVEDATSKA